MNYCPNCGQKMQGRFCSNCGFDSEAEIPQATPRESKKNKIVTAMQNGVAAIKQSKVGVFVAEHKKQSMIAAAALLIAIIATIVLIISLSNIFRVGKVSKIEIGMSTEEVIDILGEPHDKSESKWYYFERGFRKDYEKVTALLESEKEADWEKALELYEKLYEDSYKQIMVTFSDGKVTKVFLDKNHLYAEDDDYQTKNKEEIKELKLDVLAGAYEQKKADSEETEFMLSDDACHPAYHIHYKDGSFFREIMSPAYEVSENKTTIHYQWSNKLGEFTLSSPLTLLFKIDSDGTLLWWRINEKEVVLPDVIKALGVGAFGGMDKIKSLTLPESVTAIPAGSLDGLSALKNLYLHENITTIDSATVTACKQLKFAEYENGLYLGAGGNPYFCFITVKNASKSATLHADVQLFASGALNGFTAELKDSEGWTVVIDGDLIVKHNGTDCVVLALSGSSNFNFDGITNVTFAKSITMIPSEFFHSDIVTVTIPESVTSISSSAFRGCSSLASITVESGNTVYHSAGNCLIETDSKTLIFGFKNSVIPTDGSVTSIGGSAFSWCDSLTSITIPSSVTSIGSWAFHCCYKLIEVYNLSSLNITAGSADNGLVGYYAKDIYTSTDVESKQFTDSSGYIFYDDGTNRYLMGYTGTDTAWTLPASCKGNNYKIYQYAFYDRDDITSVTIPASVTSIGDSAFYNCLSLTSITIPSSVTSIGSDAFYSCDSLTSITIPSSVTSIGEDAFENCDSLTSVTFGENSQLKSIGSDAFSSCDSLTSITIPSSVTSIGEDAFRFCDSLTSVTFGENSQLTSIGSCAFYSCDSLTSVYYGGSASDWRNISISSRNSEFTSATRYYYSAEEPTTAGNWWYYDSNGQPAIWPAVEE